MASHAVKDLCAVFHLRPAPPLPDRLPGEERARLEAFLEKSGFRLRGDAKSLREARDDARDVRTLRPCAGGVPDDAAAGLGSPTRTRGTTGRERREAAPACCGKSSLPPRVLSRRPLVSPLLRRRDRLASLFAAQPADLDVYGKVFCRGLARMMGWRVEVENRDRLEAFRPGVLVANHQSILDVVTFGSAFPRRTVSAGKREIGRIPIFGWFYRLSGNLVIDRQRRPPGPRLPREGGRGHAGGEDRRLVHAGGPPQHAPPSFSPSRPAPSGWPWRRRRRSSRSSRSP